MLSDYVINPWTHRGPWKVQPLRLACHCRHRRRHAGGFCRLLAGDRLSGQLAAGSLAVYLAHYLLHSRREFRQQRGDRVF